MAYTHVNDRLKKHLVRIPVLVALTLFLFLPQGAFAASPCKTAECQYYKAEKDYNTFLNDSGSKKRRDKWLVCIEAFRKAYTMEPNGAFAPASLYKTGYLYKELYALSKNKSDLENARDNLEKASDLKKSKYRHQADRQLKSLPPAEKKKEIPETRIKTEVPKRHEIPKRITVKAAAENKIETKTKSVKKTAAKVKVKPDLSFLPDPPARAIEVVEKSAGTGAQVKCLRFGSLPTRTRIVIDTDTAVSYKHGLLNRSTADPSVQRLYVDIKNSRLLPEVKSEISVDDERVKALRSGIKDKNTVRVVVEIKTFRDYKIFSLRSPSRVVIDVWGKSSSPVLEEEHDQDEGDAPSVSSIIEASDLASQFQLGVKRIVIDPGHGGHDHGAPGFEKNVHEKDIALAIAKKLSDKITVEMGLEVIMTRSDDTFITLEERTRIANRKKADLFISIHTNATKNKQAYGIETYFLNLARDKDSVAVAARENATSEKNISDLQSILDSLMRNTKITESSKLATYVQDSLVSTMSKSYDSIKNKGVKQAPFYVLLGARMPAILVETSFISNEQECKRLTNADYQDKLCDSIIKGIKTYINKTNPNKSSKRK